MTATAHPTSVSDPINASILAVSEDRLAGFLKDPFGEIATRTGIDAPLVIERVRAMIEAGSIRRVRQTLITTNLASGALVAWRVPPERLDVAFRFMCDQDPFSGHVVIRSTDRETPGSDYRLWTTVKVPQGFSLDAHVAWLGRQAGATASRVMPARCLFALGVGHIRRRNLEPGARSDGPGNALMPRVIELSLRQWSTLAALKREFQADELCRELWRDRAAEAGLSLAEFIEAAHQLASLGILGRFSTFLEHVMPHADGEPVTRYNGLFHWAVPTGMEMAAGREVGRHEVITHAYWREAGPDFGNVNVMAVAHGMEKAPLLAHKAAIDAHLAETGIPVSYTNVFWGGRSEIKPSEVIPDAYVAWCRHAGIDVKQMQYGAANSGAGLAPMAPM